jgi:Ca2+-binding EF-hand superfamily protein
MINALINSVSSHSTFDPATLAEKFFSRIDRDGDGKISADEFSTAMQKRYGRDTSTDAASDATAFSSIFQKIDADGDGQISLDEFKAGLTQVRDTLRANGRGHHHHRGPDLQKIFSEADTDGSGTVTADELKTHFEANFGAQHPGTPEPDFAKLVSRLDQNGDGELSQSEFTAMRPPAPTWQGGWGAPNITKLFSSLDADHDGRITLDEFIAGLTKKPSDTTTTEQTPTEENATESASTDAVAATEKSTEQAATEQDPAEGTSAAANATTATPTSPDVSKLFASFDTNGDGKLSQSELMSLLDLSRQLVNRADQTGPYGGKWGHHHFFRMPGAGGLDTTA